MHPFEYRAPEEIEEVRAALTEFGSDAKVLAGGQSLMILLRQGLVSPELLVSLKRVRDLAAVRHEDGGIRLGAMVTYRTASTTPEVRAAAPPLARAAGHVGSVHIRNLGTVGGSLCHADPAGDVPTVLLVLDAEAEISSVKASASYPIDGFFTDLFETRLTEQEVLESVAIPRQPPGASYGYRRFSYREGEYPLAVAACRLEWDDGSCTGARVAVGGGDVAPKRLPDVEAALVGTPADRTAREAACEGLPESLAPIPDLRGSAEWKTKVVADLVARAVEDASLRTEAMAG